MKSLLVLCAVLAVGALTEFRGEEARTAAVAATKEGPFVNSLGQEFVPVPGTQVLFCRWDTRLSDWQAFVQEEGDPTSGGIYVMKVKKNSHGGHRSSWEWDSTATWKNPGFAQTGEHPVVGVSWEDAHLFCAWLSKKEGRIYRLPTDAEWSAAVGPQKYPWGKAWPPPKGAGNYADDAFVKKLPGKGWGHVPGNDGYERTSPVGSFQENRLGLFDMGGNVWQWCEDEYRAGLNDADTLKKYPDLKLDHDHGAGLLFLQRGGSWAIDAAELLRSSYRNCGFPENRDDIVGFRCVLVVSGG